MLEFYMDIDNEVLYRLTVDCSDSSAVDAIHNEWALYLGFDSSYKYEGYEKLRVDYWSMMTGYGWAFRGVNSDKAIQARREFRELGGFGNINFTGFLIERGYAVEVEFAIFHGDEVSK